MDSDEELSRGSDGALVSPSSPRPRSASDTRQRKLRKVTRACDACKSKKKACTGTIPCGPCVRRKVNCTYDTTYHRGVAVTPPPSSSHPRHDSPTPISQPTTQETESDSTTPYGRHEQRHSANVADQYWGPTSAHSFLGWAVRDLPTPSNVVTSARETSKTSIFHFGDRVAPEVHLAGFEWPDRGTAEGLTRRYFDFACPTYRTLHQPTIERMVNERYGDATQYGGIDSLPGDSAASYAVLLMVFSTATMFQSGADGRMRDADEAGWKTSELYFIKAEQLLSQETGVPTLQSAQARFLMVLYLLSSSRANKAWFTLGTAIQLMMALGLHSRRSRRDDNGGNLVQRECRRRIIWGSYTLDKYLSVILGRPCLWHDGDVDEELPARVNDIDLLPNRIQSPKRDCVMDAPVFHALLARTLSRTAKEPYVVAGISNRDQLHTSRALCESVAEWQAGLPPLLSGSIHPSSLVPVFQRQLTVLQLARYHLLMFITRPLLLRNYGQIWPDCEASYVYYLGICLTAARDAIELVLTFVRENQLFHAFWYSQYIAFNALSIIYIYLIQVQRGRILPISNSFNHTSNESQLSPFDESTLYRLSETAQCHLADATVRNAPSWKYSAILQDLRRELERLGLRTPAAESSDAQREPTSVREVSMGSADNTLTPAASQNYRHVRDAERLTAGPSLAEPNGGTLPFPGMPRPGEAYFADPRTEYLFDSFATDKDLMLDFWPQLDSLPITYLG
ncbi:fungal-specific transcription factor domain-containing protein [Aspergillus cavernicola]|uniref:Fungal-specific transcription factor domain-containing protein n=1 Tax=Aspergillus cavernicola TaxID=176166 RepID=A0ABR4HTM8_9EURO